MLAPDLDVGITPYFFGRSRIALGVRLLRRGARFPDAHVRSRAASYRERSTRASSQTGSVDSYTLPSAPKMRYLSKLRANHRS